MSRFLDRKAAEFERISTVDIEYTDADGERTVSRIGTSFGWDSLEDAIKWFEKDNKGCKVISIKEPPRNGGNPDAYEDLCRLIQERRPDITQKELDEFRFWILDYPTSKYSDDNAIVVPFDKAAAYLRKVGNDNMDLVMFRPFNVVLFNVRNHISHEIFCGNWYRIFKYVIFGNESLEDALFEHDSHKRNEDAENFLHAGYGFFQSGAFQMFFINASEDHPLTFAEKQVFKGIKVKYLSKD